MRWVAVALLLAALPVAGARAGPAGADPVQADPVQANPVQAEEVFQVSTITALAGGQFDGDTTTAELLRHGDFGLGTFNGVDGEMIVLDGKVYRATPDGHVHTVAATVRTPFAVVVPFHRQQAVPVLPGLSYAALQTALDALPGDASRILVVRIDGHFPTMVVRSEPGQAPPYRPLVEVIKAQQVVHTLRDVDGTLVGFRFPAAASSVNVAGWHFHFVSEDRTTGGHVLDLTTGGGQASIDQVADLLVRFPATAPSGANLSIGAAPSIAATQQDIQAIEHPRP